MNTVKVRGLFDDGNAYSILGKARRAAKAAGWSDQEWQTFSAKAKSGTYDTLLQAVMERFEDEDEDEDSYEED